MSTITKPSILPEILSQLETKFEEERQVIVHCCFQNDYLVGNLVRIWNTTFLVDKFTGERSKLLFWENISLFPYWTEVPAVKEYWFTLIFEGLPKDCKIFDLQEIIPESDGFFVEDITRNETDVYHVKL